jgi:hypothetical protein
VANGSNRPFADVCQGRSRPTTDGGYAVCNVDGQALVLKREQLLRCVEMLLPPGEQAETPATSGTVKHLDMGEVRDIGRWIDIFEDYELRPMRFG